MSAILSAEALNDFIAPSLECIKPIEQLPPPPENPNGELSVTHDNDQTPLPARTAAQISLTDCLACSGCVTSSEAVLIQLQSHTEVLDSLQRFPNKTFIALVSPQTRAALAVALNIPEQTAGNMITNFLTSIPGKAFDYVLDTNPFRELSLEYAAQEVLESLATEKKKPILTSACPGFICYLESTHPELIPHLSAMKSPQAIAGTFLKSLLHAEHKLAPEDIYIVSIMPCFDKKLEGARQELTSTAWLPGAEEPVRDIDCVITTRELLSMAELLHTDFRAASRAAPARAAPSAALEPFFTPQGNGPAESGSSGGTLVRILRALQAAHPDAALSIQPGRNVDTRDYILTSPSGEAIAKLSRCYGFRNIQNLVRKLKPPKVRRLPGATARAPVRRGKAEVQAVYTEVMACPGGCTNGGGQIKVDDEEVWGEVEGRPGSQKELLGRVDEAYFSEGEGDEGGEGRKAKGVVEMWEMVTGLDKEKLLHTNYRVVENDLGGKLQDHEVLEIASRPAAW